VRTAICASWGVQIVGESNFGGVDGGQCGRYGRYSDAPTYISE
jgi:hypothetical protein